MTDIEKIKWAIERNQSQFVRICEHCFEYDCNNCHEKNYHILINDALKGMMNNNTAIDAVPVIHGHWELYDGAIRCSHCLIDIGEFPNLSEEEIKVIMEDDKFCYNCGAKMDEVEE